MTPRRRCRPGSGAARSEPVFPTEREGPARGRRRHAVAAEALVPPGTARVAYSYRDSRRNSVHECPETDPRGHSSQSVYTPASTRSLERSSRGATVYTNVPKRRGEARSSHLCTLLRSQGHPQPKPTAQQCTQMPQNGYEGPFWPICVHSCESPRSLERSSRGATVYTNAPKRRGEAISTDLCTLLRRRRGGEAHVAGATTQPPTHTNSRSLSFWR